MRCSARCMEGIRRAHERENLEVSSKVTVDTETQKEPPYKVEN
jgi:hypothetical protein